MHALALPSRTSATSNAMAIGTAFRLGVSRRLPRRSAWHRVICSGRITFGRPFGPGRTPNNPPPPRSMRATGGEEERRGVMAASVEFDPVDPDRYKGQKITGFQARRLIKPWLVRCWDDGRYVRLWRFETEQEATVFAEEHNIKHHAAGRLEASYEG